MNKKEIKLAVKALNKMGVIVFPTDTVYGIGSLPNKDAIIRIYKIKKRDFSKKIIALVDKYDRIFEIIDETDENIKKIFKVLQNFWPGELTIVFNAKIDFVDIFDDEMETIGIRIPKNETALEIIKNVGGIVLTTSANISGENGVSDIKDINEELLKKVDFVIKEEHELTGVPSTIIKYEGGKISLLREGRITLDDIEKLID